MCGVSMGVCVERVINSGPFDKSESLHLKSFNQTLEMNKLLIVAVLLVVCIGSVVVFGAAVSDDGQGNWI